MGRTPIQFDESNLGCKSHFLDSGSFSLVEKAKHFAAEHHTDRWAFYDSDEFYLYLSDYATFVRRFAVAIDYYSNVDVIGNPKLTYRNQRILEDGFGLKPVPVVHCTCDLKWLRRYMDKGHDLIALGGLVVARSGTVRNNWLNKAFDLVCDQPSRLPKVRVHGFGVTGYNTLLRYPWWSVDSSSWTKLGAYGTILVPHKRNGDFIYNEQPYAVNVSWNSPFRKQRGRHFESLSGAERKIVLEWLDYIKVPLGKSSSDGEIIERGVVNRHSERKAANLFFFENLRKSLPRWPFPFRSLNRTGFGLCQ